MSGTIVETVEVMVMYSVVGVARVTASAGTRMQLGEEGQVT